MKESIEDYIARGGIITQLPDMTQTIKALDRIGYADMPLNEFECHIARGNAPMTRKPKRAEA